METINKAIEAVASRIAAADRIMSANETMQYSQAVLNLANAQAKLGDMCAPKNPTADLGVSTLA